MAELSLCCALSTSQTAKWWQPPHPVHRILEWQLRAKWLAHRKQIKHRPCFFKMTFLSCILLMIVHPNARWVPLQNKKLKSLLSPVSKALAIPFLISGMGFFGAGFWLLIAFQNAHLPLLRISRPLEQSLVASLLYAFYSLSASTHLAAFL